MATLEKIRQRGVLLTCIIGLALFLFIFTGVDFNSLFGESRTLVGEVNGTKLEIAEFEELVSQAKVYYQGRVDDNQLRDYVWNMWMQEVIYNDACEEAGIVVSDQEVADFLTMSVPNIDQIKLAVEQDQTGESSKYWEWMEREARLQLKATKYNALVNSSVNTNNVDAKANYNAAKAANIEFAQVSYFSQPDSLFPVSDTEIEEYYNANKNLYTQKQEQRVIKTLVFPITPSKEDYANVEAWINGLKDDFATSSEFISIAKMNSDVPYKDVAQSASKIDPDFRGFAFAGQAGDVMGPVLMGDTYKMARIVETGIVAPDSVKVRHIVVEDKALADSLVQVLKGGADFAAVAKEYSVLGSGENGGELGWINEEVDVEFSKVCYAAEINDIFTYPQGTLIHVVQVTEKSQPVDKVKLCVLQRKVEAGNETTVGLYNKAAQYIANNTTAEAFVNNAKASEGLNITTFTVAKDAAQVGSIPYSRNILRWAFGSEAKQVTEEVFECGSNYVIAMLDEVLEEGVLPLEAVKERVKLAVLNDKKAAKIITDMKAAGDNLSSLGMVLMAQNVSFASDQISNMGYEPMVAAAIPNLIKTKQIQYVKGNAGVYAIKLLSEVPQAEFNATQEIEMANMKNAAVSSIWMSLKDKAEIIDNRINFY